MKEKILMEIRPAEGGNDSKLLIHIMKELYLKACKLNGFSFEIKEANENIVVI